MKKYLIILLVLFCSIAIFPLFWPIHAESYNDLKLETYLKLSDEARNNHKIQSETVNGNYERSWIYELVCQMVVGNSYEERDVFFQQTALGQMANTTMLLYANPPAHFAYWVQDTGQALGFLRPAYAQGTGFVGLQPLMKLWKIFRDAAYVLLAIAIVILGFMIMFRRKIDPKTVLTVQNALPRVIMVLILITFSYAIAAFLIDLMYVIMYLVVSLFASAIDMDTTTLMKHAAGRAGIGGVTGFADLFAPLAMFKLENPITLGLGGGLGTLGALTGIGGGMLPGALLGFLSGNIVTAVLGEIGIGGGTGTGGIFSPILWLVFAIALVFTFLRIFVMLITAYIQILINVVIGPLQILLDVFPGTNAFRSWFMGIVSNLLTFLLVSVLTIIVTVIFENIETENLWTPPFVGYINAGLLKALIGIGGMVMIPNLVNGFKQALKSQSAIPIGAGSALAPIGSAVGMILPMAYQGTTILSMVKGHGKAQPTAQNPFTDLTAGSKSSLTSIAGSGGRPEAPR